MVITNLDARRKHWDDPGNRNPPDSLLYPFEQVEYLFYNQRVLEIGPGCGRQYERLKGKVHSYSICDISQRALNEPVYSKISDRFLLTDYSADFVVRFDVIHFWYVLHHITIDEVDQFFAFVIRHLRIDGLALFNTPQASCEPYTGDGIGTTWMDKETVFGLCSARMDVISFCEQNMKGSGYLFVARKKHETSA